VSRDDFATRLQEAAQRAREFARDYVREPLHGDLLFRLDTKCDLDSAVETLWRDGLVPVWTDLCVTGQINGTTVIGVEHSADLTSAEGMLGVVGPHLPAHYHKGDRFSVHRRAWCWDEEDLAHLREVQESVWSLDSRVAADELPELPSMEVLQQRWSADGDPLAAIARFAALHTLTVSFTGAARPQISGERAAKSVHSVVFEGLPDQPWGCEQLTRAVPHATSVHLEAVDGVWLSGRFSERVERLALLGRRLEGHAQLPRELTSLSVTVDSITDSEFAELVEGVDHIEALHLRGTRISDQLAVLLPQRFDIEFLDVVDTGISRETIDRLASQGLRMLPDYSPH